MSRLRPLILAAAFILAALPAFAMDLATAKSQGLVGEGRDGYVAAVGSASGEVADLIAEINAARRARYAEIAAKSGAPVDAVAAAAGQKVIDMTPAGQYVQDASGNWVQK